MIPVTKPFTPPFEEYKFFLEGIWERNWLTNNGPLVQELESSLKQHLQVDHLLFLGNGTIAIQIALKALDLMGEIITTPFSYVATTSSIVWENCSPKFVDIELDSFNIDPEKIEREITSKTTAILATHVFGNPCSVDRIELIAQKHNLKVIYDAAHCFDTTFNGKSVLEYGDISTISFHATKLFHTIEGGAVVTPSQHLDKMMRHLRNFGHDGPFKFHGVGINGKNSEFHAAMGLCNLKYIDSISAKRKLQYLRYLDKLSELPLQFQRIHEKCQYNYAYFPVLLRNEHELLKLVDKLHEKDIHPRRYFYPSLNTLDYVEKTQLAIAESVSSRILCLPVYHTMTEAEQDLVISVVSNCLGNS